MEEKQKVKTRRVGTLTAGILLVLIGVLFLVRLLVPSFKYLFIIQCWPCILILLGVEMILASRMREEVIYDAGAVFLVIVLAVFSMGMAGMDMMRVRAGHGYSLSGLF